MKIIEPKVELWTPENPIQHVARCARVSYMAESKGKVSDRNLYERCLKNKHNSIFRHESHYYIIPLKGNISMIEMLEALMCSPYINGIYDAKDGKYYISTNGNWLKDHPHYAKELIKFEVDDDTFTNTEQGFKLMRYTFFITTQISTTRELNRVMDDYGITESSTRYIKIGGKVEPAIVRPHWMDKNIQIPNSYGWDYNTDLYLLSCERSFKDYENLLNHDFKPQDARGVLPTDCITFVAYTAPVRVWKHIIDLRYFGTTGEPHPNAKIIAGMIKEQLENLGYEFEINSKSNN